ncbi:MAG: glycerophosphodiester phosphodiesterase family protein, partial [Prolixibacteraceae bacterium]|nr:glycerophosphodiester phosphodiesterase family protein [Prolixibacteraceae bacterium]
MKQRNIVTSILVLVTLIISGTGNMAKAQNTFIAHRGASYLAPENTLASAKLAWELGVDAVEVDVYLSADNRVMVIHDKTTKRTSGDGTNYKVAKTNSDVLRTIDVGSYKSEKYSGEKIPFIEEIIETVPDKKTLVIEIKYGAEVLPVL